MKNFALCAGFSVIVAVAGATCAPAGRAVNIAINDLEFSPPIVTVHVGDTVAWTNRDIVDHTATARSGAFDVVTPKGKPAHWRASKVGEFAYFCRLHPNMTGVVRVTR